MIEEEIKEEIKEEVSEEVLEEVLEDVAWESDGCQGAEMFEGLTDPL